MHCFLKKKTIENSTGRRAFWSSFKFGNLSSFFMRFLQKVPLDFSRKSFWRTSRHKKNNKFWQEPLFSGNFKIIWNFFCQFLQGLILKKISKSSSRFFSGVAGIFYRCVSEFQNFHHIFFLQFSWSFYESYSSIPSAELTGIPTAISPGKPWVLLRKFLNGRFLKIVYTFFTGFIFSMNLIRVPTLCYENLSEDSLSRSSWSSFGISLKKSCRKYFLNKYKRKFLLEIHKIPPKMSAKAHSRVTSGAYSEIVP